MSYDTRRHKLYKIVGFLKWDKFVSFVSFFKDALM